MLFFRDHPGFSNQSLVRPDSFTFYNIFLDSLRLSLCFDLFMYLSQKTLSQSILYPLWKLARAPRNNHKSRRRTNLSSPWAAHGGPAYLPGPWLPVSTHHLLNTSVSPCICASRLPFSLISHLKSWVFTTYELSSGQTLSGVCKRCPWFHFETHWRWKRTETYSSYATEKRPSSVCASTIHRIYIISFLDGGVSANKKVYIVLKLNHVCSITIPARLTLVLFSSWQGSRVARKVPVCLTESERCGWESWPVRGSGVSAEIC